MRDIRQIETGHGVTREAVGLIRDRLVALTTNRSLLSFAEFPAPDSGEKAASRLYRIAQDDDDRFALYVNSSRGAVSSPVHNHTTWAVVVGFDGQELNRFYCRRANGVEQVNEFMVERGCGVAMLPEDLHSIHIDGPSINLHCYGLALERLESRQYYAAATNEWRVFPAHADIAEARPALRR